MTLGVGGLLRNGEQYRVIRDPKTKAWRIIDSWNDAIGKLDWGAEYDPEIPDEHPAVTLLTEGQFLALVNEAIRVGNIQHVLQEQLTEGLVPEAEVATLKEELVEARVQVNLLLNENAALKVEAAKDDTSESFRIRKEALAGILKIVGVDAMDKEK